MTGRPRLSRRAALLAPLALGGCTLWDAVFEIEKKPIPGERESVMPARRGLSADEGVPRITLPPPVDNAAWPQAGGNPSHLMGHLAVGEHPSELWRVNIGEGGGYRRKLLAQPVVAGGLVYTMDSDAMVTAFALDTGRRVWRFDTVPEDADSTNIGGGLAVDQGTLYATNGLGELVALDAAKGTVRWRRNLGIPLRSPPTVAEGRIFFVTIEDRLLALSASDGQQLWTYQAATPTMAVLGQPAPAFAQGLVVAGFGSGELACLRVDGGGVAWTDSLGTPASRSTLTDFSSIRGRPAITSGRVFAIGMGGLTLGLDLPTGRRLWERQVGGEDSPWIAGSWLFMISSSQEMAAISIDDGRVAWVSALPRWGNPEKQRDPLFWFGPVLAGDRLVVTGTSEAALSVSPYTGEILGRQSLSQSAAPVGPIVAHKTMLLLSDDGRLLALR